MSRHRPPTRRPPAAPGRGRRPSGSRRSTHGNVREAAAAVVEQTLRSLSPVDLHLEAAQSRCDPRDHALLHELVLGTLRWLRRLDHLVGEAANRPFEQIDPPLQPALRVAAYQLFFLDRVPDHAVVNEAVDQAHRLTHRGGASFVNGVLRRLARSKALDRWPVRESDPVRRLAIELSHPDFLVRRWLERFGEVTTRALLEANNRPKPLHLLAFRDRGGRGRLAEALIDEDVDVLPSALAPQGLKVMAGNPLSTEAFRRGDAYVQDEASQLAALIPPPAAGERILDAAAAPGGKSFALLSCEPQVRCTLADLSLGRVERLRSNLRRLGRPLPLLVADAGRLPFRSGFDRVVVDLPCSGTGTLRKHPELKWRISEEEIGRLAAQGLRLLDGAAAAVKPGGLLCAITCSLEREENEEVVARLLAARPDLRRRAIDSPGAGEVRIEEGLWRLLTADDHDGFTVNVLERVASSSGPSRAPGALDR